MGECFDPYKRLMSYDPTDMKIIVFVNQLQPVMRSCGVANIKSTLAEEVNRRQVTMQNRLEPTLID